MKCKTFFNCAMLTQVKHFFFVGLGNINSILRFCSFVFECGFLKVWIYFFESFVEKMLWTQSICHVWEMNIFPVIIKLHKRMYKKKTHIDFFLKLKLEMDQRSPTRGQLKKKKIYYGFESSKWKLWNEHMFRWTISNRINFRSAFHLRLSVNVTNKSWIFLNLRWNERIVVV